MMTNRWLWTTLLLITALTVQAEPTVDFSSDNIQTRIGKTFTTDIVITDFPKTEGGGISLIFNPNVLQVQSITLNGADWNFVNQQGVIDNVNGVISDILFSSFSGVTGDAVVATVNFKARAQGQSALTMTESQLNPFASSGQRIMPDFQIGNITVKRKTWGGCYGCHR